MADLTATDDAGNKLYGFSQVSLDTLNQRISTMIKWLRVVVILGIICILIMCIVFGYVFHNDILNNIVKECGCVLR